MKKFFVYLVLLAFYGGAAEIWHLFNPAIPFWTCCGVLALTMVAFNDAEEIVNKKKD
jgi:hypothetical protein